MPTTQTVHIQTYDYGASLSSATLRVVSTDVLVATADTVNEVTADSGLYAAVFGETAVIAAGEYRLRAIVSGKPINRYVTLAGADGEIVEARNERLAVLDSASLIRFVTEDTGETTAADGSVAKLSQGAGGGGGGDATLANQEEILARLSTTTISVTGYAQLDIYGVLQLKRGHTATLTFTSDTNNIVSDLSADTTKVFFGIKDAAGRSWLSIEGTKLANTGLQSVRFSISAALAAAMINGEHFFDVVAVYGYNASNTPKYTSLQPFTSGRAKVTDLYVDI